MGLSINTISAGALTAYDNGQPGLVVAYISSALKGKGFDVNLDETLQRRLAAYEEENRLVDLIRSSKASPRASETTFSLPLVRDLLSHQQEALSHALAVQNAANFSVPGSGKTTSTLAAYSALRAKNIVDRIVVIGPASSFSPWEDEFRETFGRMPSSLRLVGTSQQRSELLRESERFDLILCTYQMAYREKENLARLLRRARYLLVLDESHNIKNIELGPWANTALELAPLAERRMILSGTPAPHSLRDLWSQLTFLWPSEALLKDRITYEQWIVSSPEPADDLRRELHSFFIRTKKSDLGLPKPTVKFVKIPYKAVPKRQRLIIRLLELSTLQEAKKLGLGRADTAILRRWRRARTIRLLQAASNPALLSSSAVDLGDPGDPFDSEPALAGLLKDYTDHETPAKIAWVVDTVRDLVQAGSKVVVWATFVDNLVLLQSLLDDLAPLLAYGGVPAYDDDSDPNFESRERNIRDFKTRADRTLLIANPAACSESISLHMQCHDAVYLERTFNCGQFLQSMDRIHRVGMPHGTHATYHLPLIPCAVEHVLDQRLRNRQETLYRLLDDDMPVLGYDDDSALLEREDDLEAIFKDVLQEISKSAGQGYSRSAQGGRSRR